MWLNSCWKRGHASCLRTVWSPKGLAWDFSLWTADARHIDSRSTGEGPTRGACKSRGTWIGEHQDLCSSVSCPWCERNMMSSSCIWLTSAHAASSRHIRWVDCTIVGSKVLEGRGLWLRSFRAQPAIQYLDPRFLNMNILYKMATCEVQHVAFRGPVFVWIRAMWGVRACSGQHAYETPSSHRVFAFWLFRPVHQSFALVGLMNATRLPN